jgi:hypothetical protein
MHDFVVRDIQTKAIEATGLQAADPGKPPAPLKMVYPGEISNRIQAHYKRFGTLQNKTDEEENYITTSKKRSYARVFTRLEKDENGVPVPTGDTARSDLYPEIDTVMQLRDVLSDDGAKLAVHSSEVLLAAYGSWFPDSVLQSNIEVINDAGQRRLIKRHWQPGEIPEQLRAENYKP